MRFVFCLWLMLFALWGLGGDDIFQMKYCPEYFNPFADSAKYEISSLRKISFNEQIEIQIEITQKNNPNKIIKKSFLGERGISIFHLYIFQFVTKENNVRTLFSIPNNISPNSFSFLSSRNDDCSGTIKTYKKLDFIIGQTQNFYFIYPDEIKSTQDRNIIVSSFCYNFHNSRRSRIELSIAMSFHIVKVPLLNRQNIRLPEVIDYSKIDNLKEFENQLQKEFKNKEKLYKKGEISIEELNATQLKLRHLYEYRRINKK